MNAAVLSPSSFARWSILDRKVFFKTSLKLSIASLWGRILLTIPHMIWVHHLKVIFKQKVFFLANHLVISQVDKVDIFI